MTHVLEEIKAKTLLVLPSEDFAEVFLGVKLIFSILKRAAKPRCNINRCNLMAGDGRFHSSLSVSLLFIVCYD